MQDINEVLLESFLKSLMIYFILPLLLFFVEVSGHNREFSDLRFPNTMFTLHTSFKPFAGGGGGGGKNPVC